jgi:hypothetical protein
LEVDAIVDFDLKAAAEVVADLEVETGVDSVTVSSCASSLLL